MLKLGFKQQLAYNRKKGKIIGKALKGEVIENEVQSMWARISRRK